MKKTKCKYHAPSIGLMFSLLASNAFGQQAFVDINNLPELDCKSPPYNGSVITPAGVPVGKGGADQIPVIVLPGSKVYGKALWTYTAPNDGINRVQYGVTLPEALKLQYERGYVPAGTGFNVSYPNEFRVLIVAGEPKIDSSKATFTNPVLSSATHNVALTDALRSALAGTMDTAVSSTDRWSVVIQEARNVTNPTANNPNWVQTNYVCTLPIFQAGIY
jgi:hypothetical protein